MCKQCGADLAGAQVCPVCGTPFGIDPDVLAKAQLYESIDPTYPYAGSIGKSEIVREFAEARGIPYMDLPTCQTGKKGVE